MKQQFNATHEVTCERAQYRRNLRCIVRTCCSHVKKILPQRKSVETMKNIVDLELLSIHKLADEISMRMNYTTSREGDDLDSKL